MQTCRMSFIEAVSNNVVAFILSVLINIHLFPLFGFPVKLGESMLIVAVFSIVSIIRSYIMRRIFNSIKGFE
jgi:hypothetical protein